MPMGPMPKKFRVGSVQIALLTQLPSPYSPRSFVTMVLCNPVKFRSQIVSRDGFPLNGSKWWHSMEWHDERLVTYLLVAEHWEGDEKRRWHRFTLGKPGRANQPRDIP